MCGTVRRLQFTFVTSKHHLTLLPFRSSTTGFAADTTATTCLVESRRCFGMAFDDRRHYQRLSRLGDLSSANILQSVLSLLACLVEMLILRVVYAVPPEDVNTSLLTQSSARQTFCEWKGKATYWDFKSPTTDDTVQSQIWTYQAPTEDFKAIKGYYVRPPWLFSVI